jgi:hypothetical protein
LRRPNPEPKVVAFVAASAVPAIAQFHKAYTGDAMLLRDHPPYWRALWDRGVDISVGIITNTISAGIVALIAIATWRWKRKRDPKHEEDRQRQQRRIAEELDREGRSQEILRRISELQSELDPLVQNFASAGSAGDADHLQKAWDAWRSWLEANQLQYLPGNRKILDSWASYSDRFGAANSNQTVSQWAEKLIVQVRGTQLGPSVEARSQDGVVP